MKYTPIECEVVGTIPENVMIKILAERIWQNLAQEKEDLPPTGTEE